MPTRRMIHNKISRSEQVNNLSFEAALLYTWMITHADDEGKLKGSSASVRATVFPMKELKNEDVEKLLQEIVDQDLIYRWKDEYGTYIEFPTWFKHQTLQKDRIKESQILSYREYVSKVETGDIQNDSVLETQDNTTQDNETQCNQSESNVIEKKRTERESEGKLPLIPNEYVPSGIVEHQLKRAWTLFKDSDEVFESRYLAVAKAGVRWSVVSAVTNEISRDETIQDKGKEFEKRMKLYITNKK